MTRLRISVKFEDVTNDGAPIRDKGYGSIVPEATVDDTAKLAEIVARTVREELPKFLANKTEVNGL